VEEVRPVSGTASKKAPQGHFFRLQPRNLIEPIRKSVLEDCGLIINSCIPMDMVSGMSRILTGIHGNHLV